MTPYLILMWGTFGGMSGLSRESMRENTDRASEHVRDEPQGSWLQHVVLERLRTMRRIQRGMIAAGDGR